MDNVLTRDLNKAQFPGVFDLRWIWGCAALGAIVGGGNIGWQALSYTVCNMIATKNNRYATHL